MITGIAHNAVKVTDMEKALDFYCNKIGLTKAFEIADNNGKPWIVYLKICSGSFIELFYDGVKTREKAYEADAIGYHHWCISVGNIDELAVKLHKAGFIEKPQAGLGRDENRNIWIHDADGNAVEFVEYSANSPHMKACDQPYDYARKGFTGIGHMAFVVSDMEKALEFYCDKLGFKNIYALDDEQGNPWIIYLKVCDGTYIELFYNGTKKYDMNNNSAGFMHICLECDDVYKTVEELRVKDIEIDTEPNQGKDKNYQAWIHDPDGNKIELMTIDPSSPQANA